MPATLVYPQRRGFCSTAVKNLLKAPENRQLSASVRGRQHQYDFSQEPMTSLKPAAHRGKNQISETLGLHKRPCAVTRPRPAGIELRNLVGIDRSEKSRPGQLTASSYWRAETSGNDPMALANEPELLAFADEPHPPHWT